MADFSRAPSIDLRTVHTNKVWHTGGEEGTRRMAELLCAVTKY